MKVGENYRVTCNGDMRVLPLMSIDELHDMLLFKVVDEPSRFGTEIGLIVHKDPDKNWVADFGGRVLPVTVEPT